MSEEPAEKDDFKKYLEERFSPKPETPEEERIIDSIIDLISKHQKNSLGAFLLDCAMMISKQFDFKEITIGLKDKTDNLYKYGVFLGIMPATQEALKKIQYTYEDMVDHVKYPDVKIGKITEYVMTVTADTEQKTFNRPGLLRKPRDSMEQFIEGDYIDIYMYGGGDELIGWVELGSPKDWKIPDKTKIKWIELTVSIMSRIVWERMYRRDLIIQGKT